VLGDTDFADGKGIYSQFFPQLTDGYYSFEWGGVQFFAMKALNTRGGLTGGNFDVESPQIKWLESQLSRDEVQKAPFRVVFLHDPVYISRGRSSDVLRRIWAPLFQKYKVDVVFASWHLYERSTDGQVTYIISGGAGAELIWMNKDPAYHSQADARQYHFCRVDLNSNAMTISAIAPDGTVLDNITLTPRSGDVETAGRLERAAKRLENEILINDTPGGPVLPVYFFASDCEFCRDLLDNILPKMAKENHITLAVFYYDLGVEGAYDLFLNAGAEFGRQGMDFPAIFVGRSALGGQSEIEKSLPEQLEKFRKEPQSYLDHAIIPFTGTHDTAALKEEQFNTITYAAAIKAGFLDGIKPCAFTAIIFLISFLILLAGTRGQIMYAGVYTLTVFIVYFVIGLAFYNFANAVFRNSILAIIVNALLLFTSAAISIFSVADFIRCQRGAVSGLALKLPSFLNSGVREKIRSWNNAALAGVLFIPGILMAGVELICAGKIYLPIVTMISLPQFRIKAVSCLFTYNIAFMAPLIIVFLLAGLVISSRPTGAFLKRHPAAAKLGAAVLFVAMALIMVFNLRRLL
jgi:cytochrome c biogenesis protein CcdA